MSLSTARKIAPTKSFEQSAGAVPSGNTGQTSQKRMVLEEQRPDPRADIKRQQAMKQQRQM